MKQAILCFTRVPIPGRTKTRLMPHLSPEECARLHTAFLQDIAQVCHSTAADLFVAHTPDPGAEMLKDIFPTALGFFPQEGTDLGQRMHNALTRLLAEDYEKCLLIGSDVPLITSAHLQAAFAALNEADVTLGPVEDGGYYLVGLKRPCPALFQNQTYGSGSVYENTLAAAISAGLKVSPAPGTMDVDTWEDLLELRRETLRQATYVSRCLDHLFAEKELAP